MREDAEVRRLGAVIVDRHLHEDIGGAGLGVLDSDVEIATLIEDTRIDQLVLALIVSLTAAVFLEEVVVRKGCLRIFVEHPHVGMRWRSIEVPPQLLDVLAMIAFAICEAEHALLQNRIAPVPEG